MASISSLFTSPLILSTTITLLGPSVFADNILYPGETLSEGESLTYRSYKMIMQRDCNLVLYDDNHAEWSTGTNNRGSGCYAQMQTDGNLVVYEGGFDRAVWASNTDRGQGNSILVLQGDRNVVIYGGAVWASRTNRVGTADAVIAVRN